MTYIQNNYTLIKYINRLWHQYYTMGNTMNRIDKSRFVSLEQANGLITDGYYAIDPHCHSSYSYDVPDVKVTNPESVIKVQKKMGLNFLLSDHDTINGYNYLKKKGYKVVPCSEITIKPRIARKIDMKKPVQTLHINVFGMNNHDMTMLREIADKGDLDEFVHYIKYNDLDCMYNHPFWRDMGERMNWRVVPGIAKNYFDVLELNGTFSKGMNDLVVELAGKMNKGIIAGSDSHTGNPGRGFVMAEGKNFKDFWENVKAGNMFVHRKDFGLKDIITESSLIVNQVFNANTRPILERKYTPATEFKPFNVIARSVTSGRLKNKYILKTAIQMALQGVNYSAGPVLAWKIHMLKDKKEVHHIKRNMSTVMSKMNHVDYKKKSI